MISGYPQPFRVGPLGGGQAGFPRQPGREDLGDKKGGGRGLKTQGGAKEVFVLKRGRVLKTGFWSGYRVGVGTGKPCLPRACPWGLGAQPKKWDELLKKSPVSVPTVWAGINIPSILGLLENLAP